MKSPVSDSQSSMRPTGSPSATQLRPDTAYMRKHSLLGVNMIDLSPSTTRFADASRARATSLSARAMSSAVGGVARTLAGRSRRASEKTINTSTTPTEARRNRGALLSSYNYQNISPGMPRNDTEPSNSE